MIKQIWRKWYLWAVLAGSLVIPIKTTSYFLSYTDVNEKYLNEVMTYIDHKKKEELGKPNLAEFNNIAEGAPDKVKTDLRYSSDAIYYPLLAKASDSKDDVLKYNNIYSETLRELEDATTNGEMWDDTVNPVSDLYHWVRVSNNLRLANANRSIANGDLEAAFQEISKSEILSRSFSAQATGIYRQRLARQQVNTTLESIFDQPLGKDELEKLNKVLLNLTLNPPKIRESVLLDAIMIEHPLINNEPIPMIIAAGEAGSGGGDGTNSFMKSHTDSNHLVANMIDNVKRNTHLMSNHWKDQTRFLDKYDYMMEMYYVSNAPLTRIAYVTKQLKHIGWRNENIFYYKTLIPKNPRTTPKERFTVDFGGVYFGNWEDYYTSNRVTITKTQLLAIASAARLYREETGAWPEKLHDFPKETAPQLYTHYHSRRKIYTPRDEHLHDPIGYFHHGDVPMNNISLLTLLHHYIPSFSMRNGLEQKGSFEEELQTFVERNFSPQWTELNSGKRKVVLTIPGKFLNIYSNKDLRKLLYQKQLINEGHFNFTTSAVVRIKDEGTNEYNTCTDDYLKEHEISRLTNGFTPDINFARNIDAKLIITLELPKQHYAIWSTGPDEINQHGELAYPTSYRGAYRTTPLPGDIIIFPGGL